MVAYGTTCTLCRCPHRTESYDLLSNGESESKLKKPKQGWNCGPTRRGKRVERFLTETTNKRKEIHSCYCALFLDCSFGDFETRKRWLEGSGQKTQSRVKWTTWQWPQTKARSVFPRGRNRLCWEAVTSPHPHFIFIPYSILSSHHSRTSVQQPWSCSSRQTMNNL